MLWSKVIEACWCRQCWDKTNNKKNIMIFCFTQNSPQHETQATDLVKTISERRNKMSFFLDVCPELRETTLIFFFGLLLSCHGVSSRHFLCYFDDLTHLPVLSDPPVHLTQSPIGPPVPCYPVCFKSLFLLSWARVSLSVTSSPVTTHNPKPKITQQGSCSWRFFNTNFCY